MIVTSIAFKFSFPACVIFKTSVPAFETTSSAPSMMAVAVVSASIISYDGSVAQNGVLWNCERVGSAIFPLSGSVISVSKVVSLSIACCGDCSTPFT